MEMQPYGAKKESIHDEEKPSISYVKNREGYIIELYGGLEGTFQSHIGISYLKIIITNIGGCEDVNDGLSKAAIREKC